MTRTVVPVGSALDDPVWTARTGPQTSVPFLPRTIELGTFPGIRDGGTLVAMAGERLRLPS